MKTLLIVTTALVSVASAVAGPLAARELPSAHYGLDANDTFLCDYGAYNVTFSAGYVSQSSGIIEKWTRAAVPVKGRGETISAIEAANLFYSSLNGYPGLSVAIYSSRHNKPFTQLAGARQSSNGCPVTSSIGPIQLQKGKKYWVVEKTEPKWGSPSSIFLPMKDGYKWFYRTTKTHDAKWQSGVSGCSGFLYQNCHLIHSGAWEPMTGGTPYVKLISGAQKRNPGSMQTVGTPTNHKFIYAPDVRSENPTPLPARAGNRGPP